MRSSAHDNASLHPRPGQRARDLGQTGIGRDIVLVSRPKLEELVSRHHFEVATWVAAKGVATWKKLRRDVAEMGLG